MIKRKCKQCGKEFTLNDSEINFYNEKNLELPKRCSSCRKQNKNNNLNKNNNFNKEIAIEENNKNNSKHNESYKSNSKGKTIRNTIIIGLLVILTLIGKVFDIDLGGLDISKWTQNEQSDTAYEFRNEQLWEDHFLKHGDEFTYSSKEEYLKGANKVIEATDSLHKKEAEDGDDIYYNESSNEIVFMSADGYIRTYFKPSEGIEYYNRQ